MPESNPSKQNGSNKKSDKERKKECIKPDRGEEEKAKCEEEEIKPETKQVKCEAEKSVEKVKDKAVKSEEVQCEEVKCEEAKCEEAKCEEAKCKLVKINEVKSETASSETEEAEGAGEESNNASELLIEESLPKRIPKHPAILLVTFSRTPLLVPKFRILRKAILDFAKKRSMLTNKKPTFYKRFVKAKEFATSGLLEKISRHPFYVQRYLMTGFKFPGHHTKQKKFKLNHVYLSLPLLQICSRSYDFLALYFNLPKRVPLKQFLNIVPFKPGINKEIFRTFEERCIWDLKINEAEAVISVYCSLLWRTFPIHPSKHVTLFMVRGLLEHYMQPIACFVIKKNDSDELMKCIKEVIIALCEINLRVVATVCDDSPSNQEAIRRLVEESREMYENHQNFSFIYSNFEIFPIYDTSILLSKLRRAFMLYDVSYRVGEEDRIASFRRLKELYAKCRNISSEDYDGHEIKLKDGLFKTSSKQNNDVYYAKQLFSQTISVYIRLICFINNEVDSCLGTRVFLSLFNDLFDTMNSKEHTYNPEIHKEMYESYNNLPLSENSKIFDFWQRSKGLLQTMQFIDQGTGLPVPSELFQTWITTIQNTQEIWNVVEPYKQFFTHNLSLDPLRYFLHRVQGMNGNRKKITLYRFLSTIKIMTFTNGRLNLKAQCEKDYCYLLDNYHGILIRFWVWQYVYFITNSNLLKQSKVPVRARKLRANWCKCLYRDIARFISHRILKQFGHCACCKSYLLVIYSCKGYNVMGIKKNFIAAVQQCNESIDKPPFPRPYHNCIDDLIQLLLSSLDVPCTDHKIEVCTLFATLAYDIIGKTWLNHTNVRSIGNSVRIYRPKPRLVT